MNIILAQLDYTLGDFEGNVKKIIEAAHLYKGAQLVIFSELSVCGGLPFDLLRYDDFIEKCEASVNQIAKACSDIPMLIGAPVRNDHEGEKPLYNAAIYLFNNERIVFRKKQIGITNLNETKYFQPAPIDENGILQLGCKKIGITIGDDICNISSDALMLENRVDDIMKSNADMFVNIAYTPFDCDQINRTRNLIRQNVIKHDRPFIYVNAVGADANMIFAGGSMIYGYNANVVASLPLFEEQVENIGMQVLISTCRIDKDVIPNKIELIHDALVLGLRDYFRKQGFKKAVLGLSGGIDSALVMELAAEALGAENVLAVLMPSQFSTDHSVNDAMDLVKKLGSPYFTIPIKPVFDSFDQNLKPVFEDRPFDVTEENLQARIRGTLVMAISNKFGNILLNTSNKSEAAVGYGTLYGDLCGGLSVLGDVYKTDVFALARWINRKVEIIPWHTINKAPSAELRPDQKDSDSLPDYNILDKILYQYLECNQSAKAIVEQGFDEVTVERTIKMVRRNEYKRHQVAPILRVSTRSFGEDIKLPIVAK